MTVQLSSGCRLCLDYGAVYDLDGVEEGHGLAEVGADLLDGVGGFCLADAGELLAAGLVLFDELLGEGAVLDLVEELLHGLLGRRR